MGIFKGREGVTPVSNKAVAKQGKVPIIAEANIVIVEVTTKRQNHISVVQNKQSE